jgi:hypothetical protein
MPSSRILRRSDLVNTDVSEELIASINRMIRISEIGTMLAVTSNRRTLRGNTICIYYIYHILYVCIVFLRGLRRLLVTANVHSSLILVTLMMETPLSSETSFLQEPHGVTSQKTAFFDVTSVRACQHRAGRWSLNTRRPPTSLQRKGNSEVAVCCLITDRANYWPRSGICLKWRI